MVSPLCSCLHTTVMACKDTMKCKAAAKRITEAEGEIAASIFLSCTWYRARGNEKRESEQQRRALSPSLSLTTLPLLTERKKMLRAIGRTYIHKSPSIGTCLHSPVLLLFVFFMNVCCPLSVGRWIYTISWLSFPSPSAP